MGKLWVVVGGCVAGYDWHFYGLQDSIDYILYQCAKEAIAEGYTIEDKALLDKDYSLPAPPKGSDEWNKKIAMASYRKGSISERKLGYILADIEFKYWEVVDSAQQELSTGKINKATFQKLTKEAKLRWLGE